MRSLDLFSWKKIIAPDFFENTLPGAWLSISAAVVMGVLFVAELSSYLAVKVTSEVVMTSYVATLPSSPPPCLHDHHPPPPCLAIPSPYTQVLAAHHFVLASIGQRKPCGGLPLCPALTGCCSFLPQNVQGRRFLAVWFFSFPSSPCSRPAFTPAPRILCAPSSPSSPAQVLITHTRLGSRPPAHQL